MSGPQICAAMLRRRWCWRRRIRGEASWAESGAGGEMGKKEDAVRLRALFGGEGEVSMFGCGACCVWNVT